MDEAQDTLDYYLSGYHTFSTSAGDAHTALGSGYAQSDAIWWLASHGCEGCMELVNTTPAKSTLWIDAQDAGTINHNCDSNAGRDECLSEHTFAQMHDIKLMVYMGCNTGGADPWGRTLPAYSTGVLGVDSAVGFSDIIEFSATTSDTWAHYFSLYLVFGYSVSSATSAAAQAVHNATGGYHGYNSYVTSHGGTFVEPAGYGS